LKIRMIAAAGLVLAAACGGGSGGAPSEGPGPRSQDAGMADPMAGMSVTGGGQPSVFALLGERERLALTGTQVTALDSINRAWAVVNDTLQRQLRTAWGDRRGRRSSRSFEQARPVLLRIAENNDVANRAVEAVLNQDQRRTACAIQTETREERGRDGRTLPPGMRRRPGMAPFDTIPGARALRGWPWCSGRMAADSTP
jgi:hypothetical protein